MRLKTKLVLAATGTTFAIVIVLSIVFLGELLRQRIAQTASATNVMTRQVLMMTQQAVQTGLRARPPADSSDEALHEAVVDALRSHQPLLDTMNSFVRYSESVLDVSVTDAHGLTLLSTDALALGQQAPTRMEFQRLRDAGVVFQAMQVLGKPQVLDASALLERNKLPFLVVHVGVRSTFLKNNYVPRLEDGLLLALMCALIATVAAGLLTNLALRPIEEISSRLEVLSAAAGQESPATETTDAGAPANVDAVVRVSNTIDRLGRRMKSSEAEFTDLQTNLNQMLDTLRDGVVLFSAERRAVMASDAVAKFLGTPGASLTGKTAGEIFGEGTALGQAVLEALTSGEHVTAERVRMEDGREVEFSLDWLDAAQGSERKSKRESMGTLLTLRDRGSAMKLEQELEVSRRLAAVGRLTAGVGHEVKNPINAMVVHLELLRSKLETAGEGRSFLLGAQRHVEILAGEMERLDRVVQTLADFTRPMELRIEELDLRQVVEAVVELTAVEMKERNIDFVCRLQPGVMVRADGELLRQALLNLVLNGSQAMPTGGRLRIGLNREKEMAIVEIADEGEGIAPELMPRIFDLYFTTKPSGSGIGLAMTYRIVQMHGGSMEAESTPGAGAVFTIRLPAVRAQAEPKTAVRTPVESRA